MTEFRLLGSLDAVEDGRSIGLGGTRQRTVLAVLLLHPEEVVSIDAIFDAVWGAHVPKTAVASLHNCISRLRRELGHDAIETRAPGYALRADPGTIDTVRFERLLAEAAGMPAPERFALLSDALALWHGTALADFLFEDFAQPFILRLNALRLEAIEGRIEAQLELGRHAEVIAEIEALAQAHPSHERLRYLQMLALYRGGRQVDALGVFQEARLALADELGLEPSEELRALERMILDHDPGLNAATEASPGARVAPVRDERRIVTVLRGLPLGAGDGDAERTREATAAWLALASAIVQEHGGGLSRLAGAELSGMFGLGSAREDDALRAVRAAFAIREQCGRFGTSWRCRIETRELTTHGEALGDQNGGMDDLPENEILLDPATLRLVAGAVEAVPVAGGSDYRLLGLIQGAPSVRRRFDAALVGREPELDRLEAAAEAAWHEGGPRSVLVVGEPGIGKTRLAVSLAERLRDRATTLTGRCVPYGEGPAYLPLLEVVIGAVGPGGDLRHKIGARLADAPDAERIVDCLGDLAASGATTPSADLSWAVRRFLELVARDRPLLVILDDVQWADPGLLDLVEYVAGWCERPVAIAGLARPELIEQRPRWAAGAIELGPLTDGAAQALLEGLPECKGIGPDVASTILRTADGNPLFLEQIAAMTADGTLVPGAVPPTLEALLASRLDALPGEDRDVLERASVAGREFSRSDVEALSPDTELTTIGPALMALARRRLVRPDRATTPGEDGFRFEHVLIRNAAYAALPDSRRADLHERLAHRLDARTGANAEVVGFHFEAAALAAANDTARRERLAREAALRLGEAGHQAILRLETGSAARLLERAVGLLPPGDRLLDALEIDLGHSLKNQGDLNRGVAVLESAERRGTARGDLPLRLKASVELAWMRLIGGHASADAVRALAEEAEPIFLVAGDYYSASRAARLRGNVNDLLMLFFEADEDARRSVELSARAGATLNGAAQRAALWIAGPVPVRTAKDRVELALGDRSLSQVERGYLLTSLGELQAMTGSFGVAREHIAQAERLHREFSQTLALSTVWPRAAATVELLAGDPVAAAAILEVALSRIDPQANAAWFSWLTALRGEALFGAGRIDEAAAAADVSRRAVPADELVAQIKWREVLAYVLAARGSRMDANRYAEEAVELARAAEAPGYLAESLLARAATHEDRAARLALVEEAVQLLLDKGNVARTRQVQAQGLAGVGSADDPMRP